MNRDTLENVAKVDRRRGLKWTFRIFATFILVGAGSLLFADQRLSNAIRAEEAKLLAMGVDVRKTSRESDATDDYKAIAKRIFGKSYRGQDHEPILKQLELAATKGTVGMEIKFYTEKAGGMAGQPELDTDPLDGVYMWLMDYALESQQKQDWKALDRLYDLQIRIQQQMMRGSTYRIGLLNVDSAPLSFLCHSDPITRQWLRKKLESYNRLDMVKARLSGLGREARKFESDAMPYLAMSSSSTKSWWDKALESQTFFRNNADLAFLEQWRALVADILKNPIDRAHRADWSKKVIDGLNRKGTGPAKWAAERMYILGGSFPTDMSWRRTLIELDLREQRDQGTQAPQPTWSKKYCFDSETGAPIVVKATKDTLKISSYLGASGWSSESGW